MFLGGFVMKSLIVSFLSTILLLSSISASEPVEGSSRHLYVEKIKFENHSYLHFLESWAGCTNLLIHDPECSLCLKQKTLLISELAALHDKDKPSKKK